MPPAIAAVGVSGRDDTDGVVLGGMVGDERVDVAEAGVERGAAEWQAGGPIGI